MRIIFFVAAAACVTAAGPAASPAVVNISDVEALYALVNDPRNAGVTVVLAPGRYVADVTARDAAGNPVRSTWNFVVEQQPTAAVGLPLEFTSHTPNAVVAPGRLQVRGRTAPHATVDVEVTGLAAVAGMIGVSQKLYSERVVADGAGNFAFSFQPQLQVPGMRYEVDIKAISGNQTRENKLVLFQQRS